jgi:hypothetical protein
MGGIRDDLRTRKAAHMVNAEGRRRPLAHAPSVPWVARRDGQ